MWGLYLKWGRHLWYGGAGKEEMSTTNWSKQTQTGSVGVDLGTVSRIKTTVVTVITGCSLACCGSGWVRGWVLGTGVGKSLLWFLVHIHLSWLCQPPTLPVCNNDTDNIMIYCSVGCYLRLGQTHFSSCSHGFLEHTVLFLKILDM